MKKINLNKIKNKLHLLLLRKRNKNKNFTIISQNCIGGLIYSTLGMEFLSPTINSFIEGEGFVKLVENFEYYMSLKPEFLRVETIKSQNLTTAYPILILGDINIHCVHYKTPEQAITAWERRKARINYNNIFVIANSWNMKENKSWMQRIDKCKYKSIVFTYSREDLKNEVMLKGDFWTKDERGIVRPNITDIIPGTCKRYYEKQIDIIKWLNGESVDESKIF